MADAAVAIVTGGAQGLGAEFCSKLLSEGYKVCVADVQENKGKLFVEKLQQTFGSENVIFSFCDVSKEEDFKKTFDLALETFHKVDILINNAGINLEQDPEKVLQVNLLGSIFGCRTAIKYMGKSNGGEGGIVVNMASIFGVFSHPFIPSYSATKHGIIGLTRSYGYPCNLAKDGVVFTALCPSYADTELVRASMNNKSNSFQDPFEPPGLLSTDYVAQGMLKLLNDRINGSVLIVTYEKGFQYIGYPEELKNTSEWKKYELAYKAEQ